MDKQQEFNDMATTHIRLDDENRCIECDCIFLETDKVIHVERTSLPKSYEEFSRSMNDYKYINNEFVYSPIEQEPTFEEKVIAEQERQGKALEELISMIMG